MPAAQVPRGIYSDRPAAAARDLNSALPEAEAPRLKCEALPAAGAALRSQHEVIVAAADGRRSLVVVAVEEALPSVAAEAAVAEEPR